MPTPHNSARMGEIASVVLMPGDPLRAKYIADHFLENPVQFNAVRNMFGYTGTYHGKTVSVMGSGMGMPSIGIYSYELFKFYGVEKIIRVGSAGSYAPELKLFDVLIVTESWSESNYAFAQSGESRHVIPATSELVSALAAAAVRIGIPVHRGPVHSADVFYREGGTPFREIYAEHGCLAVEMESFALFHNARVLGRQAACILTISDSLITREETTAEQREKAFTDMVLVTLESL